MSEIKKKLLNFVIMNKIKRDKRGKKDKMEINHYLDVIDYVLKTGIQWHMLEKDLHYTTYFKKYSKWAKEGIFSISHKIMISILRHKKVITDAEIKNLYIDCSMIKNVGGVEKIGVNHYDRYRNGSKVSVIVTSKGIPLGLKMTSSNIHDLDLVEDNIKDISIKVIGSRLIGDKGYISSSLKRRLRRDKNIKLIHPYRSNQNRSLTSFEKNLLKRRHIVENTFSWLKSKRKLKLRQEKKIKYFEEFWYLGLLDITINKIRIENNT